MPDIDQYSHLQIVLGKPPYEGVGKFKVMKRVVDDKGIPDRPRSASKAKWSPSDALWKLLEECWAYDPSKRPEMTGVKRTLSALYKSNGF